MPNIVLSEHYQPTDRQSKAHELAWDKSIDYLLYGGAKGGGKSVMGCWQSLNWCLRNPGIRGYACRTTAADFRKTTLETWKKFIPKELYEIRDNNKEQTIKVPCVNARIDFGGVDRENEGTKFGSAEYGFVFADEAHQLEQWDFAMLDGTLRQKGMPNKFLLTANPCTGWLKEKFIPYTDRQIIQKIKDDASGKEIGLAFVQALPGDNPHLPEKYIIKLKESYKFRPELLKAYLYGNWDDIAGGNLVIPGSSVKIGRNAEINGNGVIVISADIARFGDDSTVIYVWDGYKVIYYKIYGKKDTMSTAGILTMLRQKYNAKMMFIDEIGVGAGVVDRLVEINEPVFPVTSSRSANDEQYYNLRSEIWFQANDLIADGKVEIPDDPKLLTELSTPMYTFSSNGKMKVEPKEEIKKRLGRSPDRADAFVTGIWGRQFVQSEQEERWYDKPAWQNQRENQQYEEVGYGERV